VDSKVSLFRCRLVVLNKETKQDSNKVHLSLLLVSFLNSNKSLDSKSPFFKNSIDKNESESDKLLITFDVFNY